MHSAWSVDQIRHPRFALALCLLATVPLASAQPSPLSRGLTVPEDRHIGAAAQAASSPASAPASSPIAGAGEKVDGCLHHDYTAIGQWLDAFAKAVDQDDHKIADEAGAKIRRCMTFEVSFFSTLTIHAADDLRQTITGVGRVTLELAPGLMQDAGYDFASPPGLVRAPVVWSNVSISGGSCTNYRVVPSPPTKFAFWLGIDTRAQPKAALVVSPDGAETHIVQATCQGRSGIPAGMSIFTPGWIALYSLDPGSDEEFKIEMPGATGRAIFAQQEVTRKATLPSGQGRVEARTVIVVTHKPPKQD